MDESIDNPNQTGFVNQPPQGVPTPTSPVEAQNLPQPPVNAQTSTQQPTVIPLSEENKPKKNKKAALIIMFVILLLLVIATVFVIKNLSKSGNPQSAEQPTSTVTPTISDEQTNSETTSAKIPCDNFPEMLESCTKFACQFTHPITGETMTREIIGINNDKCVYTEQMPNSGRMDCEYTEAIRIAVAKYYSDLAGSKSYGASISAELNPEGSELNKTYTINGKVVDNPLQEALDEEQCIVSGY